MSDGDMVAPCRRPAANSCMTKVSRYGVKAPGSACTGRGAATGPIVLAAADEHRVQERAEFSPSSLRI
jgi:hypothetical protein